MKYNSVVHARIDDKTYARIAAIAEKRDRKLGLIVRELLEKALKGQKQHARKKTKPT